MAEDSSQQLAIRLPLDLLSRIDEFTLRLEEETPGLRPNRAVTIRVLLTRALDAADLAAPKKTKTKKAK